MLVNHILEQGKKTLGCQIIHRADEKDSTRDINNPLSVVFTSGNL